ncbi:calcium:calmodulin dependent protein kinase type-like protein [Leptotrombidium deliense]|uniref:Calcium:calmodulin dependent protein kinase type-like protein n=1 Tax=Leptotrombidium deliense TaxID=299467 RepID=A0A443SGS7_9ACAR|nr:calcium:calmodulin dependent protein kinase type-like protein [Leptotrombidium deliense]
MAKVNPKKDSKVTICYDFKEDLARGRYAMLKRCVMYSCNTGPGKEFVAKMVTKVGGKYSRLQRELGICKNLVHENVVRLLHSSEDERTNFLLFELIDGGNLEDYIEDHEFLNETKASLFLKQLFSGIDYIHARNIIHRNLRAENILVHKKQQNEVVLKIAGFGLAIQCKDDTYQRYSPIGVANFMAPEIVNNEKYGKPADLWSLGVLTYKLLAGYPPFDEKSKETLKQKIIHTNYEFDPPEWSQISNEAKDLIANLLNKDPKKRLTANLALTHQWILNIQQVVNALQRPITYARIDNNDPQRRMVALMIALHFLAIIETSI